MNTRFLQTEFWTSFKAKHGWKAYYFNLNDDGSITPLENNLNSERLLSVMVRSFSVKIKKFSIAYVPMAPEYTGLPQSHFALLEKISNELKKFLPKDTICIRYDPPVDFFECEERDNFVRDSVKTAKKISVVKAPVAVQPPDTTILGLSPSEDELLAGMRNKWRYNVRLASKKGVSVSSYTADSPEFTDAFEQFYRLFEETSKRDGVSFHGKDYYFDLLNHSVEYQKKSSENPLVKLYIAKHEDDYLAGIITLFCKREAVYLYGASGNVKRNLMPAYLLQWTAIQDAKKYGCPCYDFYGMPPTDNENHPMHGLYLFKTGFGGKIIHRPGSWDVVLKKYDYSLYIAAEKLRAWYHRKFLKKLAGR